MIRRLSRVACASSPKRADPRQRATKRRTIVRYPVCVLALFDFSRAVVTGKSTDVRAHTKGAANSSISTIVHRTAPSPHVEATRSHSDTMPSKLLHHHPLQAAQVFWLERHHGPILQPHSVPPALAVPGSGNPPPVVELRLRHQTMQKHLLANEPSSTRVG